MRKAQPADESTLLEWRNYWRRQAGEPEITQEEHDAWIKRRSTLAFIFDRTGVVWFNTATDEWSFYLSPDAKSGAGTGYQICRKAVKWYTENMHGHIVGRVRIDNLASRKIHERLGFRLTSAKQPDILIYELN